MIPLHGDRTPAPNPEIRPGEKTDFMTKGRADDSNPVSRAIQASDAVSYGASSAPAILPMNGL